MTLSQWRDFAPQAKLPATWTDGVEQLVSNYASPNLVIDMASSTSLRVKAGAAHLARVLAVAGKPRWIEADASATVPGGTGAGTLTLYAVGYADTFATSPGPPPFEVNNTTSMAFTLKIGTPTGSGSEAISRPIATMVWDGTSITSFAPLIGLRDPAATRWETVLEASASLSSGSATGQRWMPRSGGSGIPAGYTAGLSTIMVPVWTYRAADDPAGLTPEYRMLVSSWTNTNPNAAMDVAACELPATVSVDTNPGLILPATPFTTAKVSTGSVTYTPGGTISTVAYAVTRPALTDGRSLAMAFNLTGTPAANSYWAVDARLQRRYV